MATQSIPQPHTTPVFAPDGTIAQIPDQYLPDAISHGGKLAVQMKTPDGGMHYVPHDQVVAAQKAGGVVNTEQGTPDAPKPAEGFWHSLGSVLGLTKEQMVAANQQAGQHPWQTIADAADPLKVPKAMVQSAITNAPALIKKAYSEAQASNDALEHKDVASFLIHQIGGMGYTGAAAASPVLGTGPAKAGEQLGEGNVKGGLGTATGIIAPIVAGGAFKGKAPAVEAPNVFEGEPPASIPAGKPAGQPGIINRAASRVADANLPAVVNLLPKVAGVRKVASFIASKTAPAAAKEVPVYGSTSNAEVRGPYQPYQGDLSVTPGEAREVIPSEREAANPTPAPAAPPKTSQVLKDAGVTQAMKEAGIAAPSASMNPVRTTTGSLGITGKLAPRGDIQFPPGLSGEDAAMMQLTRYNISELRSGASKRGIPITPKDTHADLIQKIQGSLTPDETAGFTAAAQATKVTPSKFPENNLMAQNLNDAATALQQAKGSPYEIASLRNAASRIQQHPESIAAVDLTKTKIPGIDKRIGKRIADFLEQQKAVPGQDEVQTTTGQPMSMLEAMRASLIQRGVKPPY